MNLARGAGVQIQVVDDEDNLRWRPAVYVKKAHARDWHVVEMDGCRILVHDTDLRLV